MKLPLARRGDDESSQFESGVVDARWRGWLLVAVAALDRAAAQRRVAVQIILNGLRMLKPGRGETRRPVVMA